MQDCKEVMMGMVRLAVVLSLVVAGQAFATSQVSFELELGGDNHASDIQALNYAYFTSGSAADGQQFPENSTLTWAVGVSASGVQDSGNGAGSEIQGVANYVFDLELHADSAAGPLVTGANFLSTIHDGTTNCSPLEQDLCSPICLAGAGFAFSFDVKDLGFGPGRAIDQLIGGTCPGGANPGGGPNMGVFLFPTIEPGKLLGMGAGYSQWNRSGAGTFTEFGLGQAMLGNGPVNEGQLDLTGLAPGTYVLVLNPGNGINVLRGDVDLTMTQNAFAASAEAVNGDTITFEIGGAVCDLMLVSAVSRHTHGAAGDFDKDLNLNVGSSTTEGRVNGPLMLVLVFNSNVVALDGALNVTTAPDTSGEVILSQGTGAAVISGDKIEVFTSGYTSPSCVSVTVQGIEGTSCNTIVGDNDVHVKVVYGDVDGTGIVNILDQSSVKANLFQVLNATNYVNDLDVSGLVNILDQSIVKGQLFESTSCP